MLREIFRFFDCCKKREETTTNKKDEIETTFRSSNINAPQRQIVGEILIDNEDFKSNSSENIHKENNDIKSQESPSNMLPSKLESDHHPFIFDLKETKYTDIKLLEHSIYFQKNKHDLIHNKEVFSPNLIRIDEKENLQFTKKGIIEYSEYLLNLDDFCKFYDKEGLKLAYRKAGSNISKDFMVGRAEYKLKKSDLGPGVGLNTLLDIMYKPEQRLKWDTSIKYCRKLDENEESYVIHNHMNSPIFFISERDTVEKRVEFFYNDIFYSWSSSVEDAYLPVEKNVIRCKTFINIYIVSQDEENYFFMSFNQLDIKMSIPDNFLNMMLPSKISNFYKILIETVNKNQNGEINKP